MLHNQKVSVSCVWYSKAQSSHRCRFLVRKRSDAKKVQFQILGAISSSHRSQRPQQQPQIFGDTRTLTFRLGIGRHPTQEFFSRNPRDSKLRTNQVSNMPRLGIRLFEVRRIVKIRYWNSKLWKQEKWMVLIAPGFFLFFFSRSSFDFFAREMKPCECPPNAIIIRTFSSRAVRQLRCERHLYTQKYKK